MPLVNYEPTLAIRLARLGIRLVFAVVHHGYTARAGVDGIWNKLFVIAMQLTCQRGVTLGKASHLIPKLPKIPARFEKLDMCKE